MDPKLRKIRKRLYTDFPYYSRHALKIRTKEGEIQPLVLNPAQELLQDAVDKQFEAEGKIRVVILKARQQGLSTYVGGYLYHNVSQQKAKKAMVVTHTTDSTRALFDMTRRYHEHVPELLKPHTRYSSRKEISFDVLDSSYVVATAGQIVLDEAKRLVTYMHRACFLAKSSANDIWNGLVKLCQMLKALRCC